MVETAFMAPDLGISETCSSQSLIPNFGSRGLTLCEAIDLRSGYNFYSVNLSVKQAIPAIQAPNKTNAGLV